MLSLEGEKPHHYSQMTVMMAVGGVGNLSVHHPKTAKGFACIDAKERR